MEAEEEPTIVSGDPVRSDPSGGSTNSCAQGGRTPYVRLRRQEDNPHISQHQTYEFMLSSEKVFSTSGGHQPACVLRMLLLRAGDVERNPGPECCCSCTKVIKRNQPPVRCRNCGEKRHLNCTGVSWSRRRAIKQDAHCLEGTTLWYNWTCNSCGGADGVAGQSAEEARGDARDDARGDAGGDAGGADGRDDGGDAGEAEGEETGGSGLTQGTQGDTKEIDPGWVDGKIKCDGCPGHLYQRRGQRPVCCRTCNDKRHQGCTKLTRDALNVVKRNSFTWICDFCRSKPSESSPCPRIADEVNDEAAGLKSVDKEHVRVMQWNANGINTKSDELQIRLEALDIDICLIQESKLRQGSPTPHFPGYKSYRSDRKVTKAGGGLLSLIKDTLVFEKIHEGLKGGTEAHTFRVRLTKQKWLTVTNVYCAPVNSKGQVIDIAVADSLFPAVNSSLIAGDFNAHSIVWDETQPQDERGDKLVDWIMDNSMNLLNQDCAPTRMNIATANESSPDIAFCGSLWKGKTTWNVSEAIGSSDHLPTVMTVNSKTQHQPVLGARSKWKRRDVDWAVFAEAVEEAIGKQTPGSSVADRAKDFAQILHDAGTAHVGRVKPRKQKRNIWMTPTVRGCIRRRNRLRRELKQHRVEWLEACKETNEAIRLAKAECWKEVVEDAANCEDEGKMWNFIKTLNGTPDNNSPNEVLVVNGRKLTSNKKKADAFIQEYADVSKLSFDKDERAVNRKAKRMLRKMATPNDESTTPFTMAELEKAIRKMRAKGAAGEDEIPPSFLKALGPRAKEELLSIFNQSFDEASVPQMWL